AITYSEPPEPADAELSQSAWEKAEAAKEKPTLPKPILDLAKLADDKRSPEQKTQLHNYYLRRVHKNTRDRFTALNERIDTLEEERNRIRGQIVTTPIMRELPKEKHRTTRLLNRGNFLAPGDEVQPGVPESLHPLGEGPRDRLALARWLVDAKNPLTARVTVNRLWGQLFGIGIVETSEDFGVQGEMPSHPHLLDWLATEMIRQEWDIKATLKLIVTSATYQQSSAVTPEAQAADPFNRLLTHGPCFRLDAEMIRDQ
ncbi:unnamed protein product, partial [marine sediment metagenome]